MIKRWETSPFLKSNLIKQIFTLLLLLCFIVFNVNATKRVQSIKIKNYKGLGLKHSAIGFLSIDYLNKIIKQDKTNIEHFLMEQTNFPAINITQSVPIIGNVNVSIFNLNIQTLDLGEKIEASLDPTSELFFLRISEAKLQLKTNFKYQQVSFPRLSGNGIVKVNTNSSYGGIQIQFSLTPDGKPQFISNVGIELYNMKISIEEGGFEGWVFNLIESLFSTQINKYIQNAIIKTIDDKLEELNNFIKQQDFKVPLDLGLNRKINLDFRFDEIGTLAYNDYNTVVGASLIRFYSDNQQDEKLPFDPVDLPKKPSQPFNDLIQVYFTDFIVNSFIYGLYQSNQLFTIVTPEMVPPGEMVQLNTTSLKIYLPILYEKFPNRLVQLNVYCKTGGNCGNATTDYPSVRVTKQNGGGVSLSIVGELLFQVMLDGNKTQDAFILALEGGASIDKIDVTTNGTVIKLIGLIDNPNINLSLKKSFIGDFDIKNLNFIVNIILVKGMVRQWNVLLQEGVPVINLTDYATNLILDDAQVSLDEGFIKISATGEYKPYYYFKQMLSNNNNNVNYKKSKKGAKKIHRIKVH
ncbi:hypothetical protein ABK040_001344 [Willaertia magna]